MSFENVLLLHGKGGSPEGSVKDIETLLRAHYPQMPVSSFQRPGLLHADGEILAEQSLAELQKRDIAKGTVLIGVSLGGLLAADCRSGAAKICASSASTLQPGQMLSGWSGECPIGSPCIRPTTTSLRAAPRIGPNWLWRSTSLGSPMTPARMRGNSALDHRLDGRPEHRARHPAGRKADCAGRKAPTRTRAR